jgi:hypothetical protein
LIAGAHQAESVVDLTTGWDKLEQSALTNLLRRAPHVRDEETLLRIAAVANKAQRRHQAGKDEGVLDANNGKSVRINLTTRLVQSFAHSDGQVETRGIEKTISITDGSAVNPSFDEIDQLLHVSSTPALPRSIEINTAIPDLSQDDLNKEMEKRGF